MRLFDYVPDYNLAYVIKALFDMPQAFSIGTLAAKATADPDLKTTTTITYTINGILYTKTATATIDLSTYSLGTQAAGKYAAYLVELNTSGTFNVKKGADADSAAAALAVLPAPTSGSCPVGILVVTNTTNPFVVGTTNSDAAGVTFTCYDISTIPATYGTGAVYLNTPSA